MHNHYNNKKILLIISIFIILFALISYFLYVFFSKKDLKSDEKDMLIDEKNITLESKKILHELKKREENNNSEVIENNNSKKKSIIDGQEMIDNKIKLEGYKPENGIDGRKETEEQKEVIKSKKIKSAKELGITEKQRKYILKGLVDPRFIFDEYYTGEEYAKNFKNPEEFNKVRMIVLQEYLNVYYPNDSKGYDKIQDGIKREALNFLRRESKKYTNGKKAKEIKDAAKELNIDWDKI